MSEQNQYCTKTQQAAAYKTTDAVQRFKEKLSAQHRRAIDEIEFADTDFYEDNIYDEPEYWRSAHYRATGRETPLARK